MTLYTDLYSFDVDVDAAQRTYNSVISAYEKLFNYLGLDVIKGLLCLVSLHMSMLILALPYLPFLTCRPKYLLSLICPFLPALLYLPFLACPSLPAHSLTSL